MFDLYSRDVRSLLLATLMACGLLATVTQDANAEDEWGVTRSFFVITPPDMEPDFFSEDGIAVVVAPHDSTSTNVVEFVGDNPDELSEFDFDSTIWQSRRATVISTDGGAYAFTVWWQLNEATPTPPPDGANAFIGPDSDVEYQETVSVFTCANGSCGESSSNDGKLKLSFNPGNPHLTVVRAIFSR